MSHDAELIDIILQYGINIDYTINRKNNNVVVTTLLLKDIALLCKIVNYVEYNSNVNELTNQQKQEIIDLVKYNNSNDIEDTITIICGNNLVKSKIIDLFNKVVDITEQSENETKVKQFNILDYILSFNEEIEMDKDKYSINNNLLCLLNKNIEHEYNNEYVENFCQYEYLSNLDEYNWDYLNPFKINKKILNNEENVFNKTSFEILLTALTNHNENNKYWFDDEDEFTNNDVPFYKELLRRDAYVLLKLANNFNITELDKLIITNLFKQLYNSNCNQFMDFIKRFTKKYEYYLSIEQVNYLTINVIFLISDITNE